MSKKHHHTKTEAVLPVTPAIEPPKETELQTITVNLDVNHTAEERAAVAWQVCNGSGPVNPNLVKVFDAYQTLDRKEFERRMFEEIAPTAAEVV